MVGLKIGKKLMMVVNTWYNKAMMFTGTPNLPSDHLAGGRGAPKSRRHKTHPMLKAYVAPTDPFINPRMLLKTSAPPRLRSASIMLIIMQAICSAWS